MVVTVLKHVCKFFDTFPIKQWTLIILLTYEVAIVTHL